MQFRISTRRASNQMSSSAGRHGQRHRWFWVQRRLCGNEVRVIANELASLLCGEKSKVADFAHNSATFGVAVVAVVRGAAGCGHQLYSDLGPVECQRQWPAGIAIALGWW